VSIALLPSLPTQRDPTRPTQRRRAAGGEAKVTSASALSRHVQRRLSAGASSPQTRRIAAAHERRRAHTSYTAIVLAA
jgi:hypothetical protein